MTKDEIIAQLIADKAELVRLLQLALGPRPQASSTERTRAWRERHSDGHRDRSGGTIGGDNVLSSEENEEREGPETNGESAERGKRHSDVPDAEFEAFKEAYPKLTRRTSWPKTRPLWDRLPKKDRPAVVVGARNYAPSRDVLSAGEMAAERFLRERRWEGWQEPEAPLPNVGKNGKPDPQDAVREYQRQRDERANVIEGSLV